MASRKCKNLINILPDEVLCIIFDHLDIESVKSVSRTCKRWNNVVFYSAYVGRFMFNVDISCTGMLFHRLTHPKETTRNPVQQLIYIAKQTERKYRNLRIAIKIDMIDCFQSIWEVIHPKITATINTLQLQFGLFATARIALQITEGIAEMPQLRSVWLKSNGFVSLHQKAIPLMRSTTVEHLELEFVGFAIDMPQLRSFKGSLLSLARPTDSPHPLVLAKLKQVKLWGNATISNGPSIIQRIRLADSLEISCELNDSLFTAICDTCSALKELRFRKELTLLDPANLDRLSSLSMLRRLTFKSVEPVRDGVLNICLHKLTQLEQLDLGYTVLAAASLLTLPHSITILTLRFDHGNERNIMHNISSLVHLSDLRLCSGRSEWQPSIETFQVLSYLKHLRVLQFCCCFHIRARYFLGIARMHQVRRLVFQYCYIGSNVLLLLKFKFPNVKRVEIYYRRYITPY